MPEMTPFEEYVQHVRNWGRQTIIFALQYRQSKSENRAGDAEQVRWASSESAAIFDRLWSMAAGSSQEAVQEVKIFIELVLEWGADYVTAQGPR
jgi:hypothetical protein